ncbi:hypothetical protein Golomagni_05521 [Golovinomyces magnicellulatus]|nr:hypothetical protein Golomagni_05521 [Golovinomyces magnicellulatus]
MATPKAEDVTLPPEGSKERFDQDLRNLAAKARQDSSGSASIQQLVLVGKAVATIVLFATFANASQRALSPTYGSIPASIWNFHLLAAGSFVGWAGNLLIRRYMDAWKLIAPVVLCAPMVQFLLEGYADEFGPVAGPVVIEALTVFPVAVFSAASLANFLEEISLPDGVKDRIPTFLADSAPGIGSWAFFSIAKWLSGNWLQVHSGTNLVYTRVGTEVFLGGVYAIFAPSKYLLLALPALLHTATLNTHVATPMATAALNETLLAQDWSLLARQESITGYVSVLQSKKDGYRVMRCDHSLLGGEWPENSGGIVGEPVYGVFAMLEAVRLVETEDAVADKDANALVI